MKTYSDCPRTASGAIVPVPSAQISARAPTKGYVQTPQRSNAARVRNMSRRNGGKLPGNSKHFCKKSKDKAVPGKRSFKR